MKICMNYVGILYVLLMSWCSIDAVANEKNTWTWLYRKTITDADRATYKNGTTVLFKKEVVPLFSQLIFSWNAFRPQHGYFSFFVQARDAQTKKWGKWHHMMDWGTGIQCSYKSSSDGCSYYVHVRLETEKNKFADAFCIKMVACNGAPLHAMHSFAVVLSNFSQFTPETIDEHITRLSSVHVSAVPTISQFALDHSDKERICSPTSCSMVVQFLTKRTVDPITFANNTFDSGLHVYGSWPFNIAHAYEHIEGTMRFFTARLHSFDEIHTQLLQGLPVIVSIRGSLPGAPRAYVHGHLLVIVGWDAHTKEVICHDPAFDTHESVIKRYAVEDFVRAWERSHRLAYWIQRIDTQEK